MTHVLFTIRSRSIRKLMLNLHDAQAKNSADNHFFVRCHSQLRYRIHGQDKYHDVSNHVGDAKNHVDKGLVTTISSRNGLVPVEPEGLADEEADEQNCHCPRSNKRHDRV